MAGPTPRRPPPTAASSSPRTVASTSPTSPASTSTGLPPYRPVTPGLQHVAPDGTVRYLFDDGFLAPNDLTATADGTLYFTDPPHHPPPPEPGGRVHAVTPDGTHRVVADGFHYPNGIAREPGGTLAVIEARGLLRLEPRRRARVDRRVVRRVGAATAWPSTSTAASTCAAPATHAVRVFEPDGTRGRPARGARPRPRHQLLLRRRRPAHPVRDRGRSRGPSWPSRACPRPGCRSNSGLGRTYRRVGFPRPEDRETQRGAPMRAAIFTELNGPMSVEDVTLDRSRPRRRRGAHHRQRRLPLRPARDQRHAADAPALHPRARGHRRSSRPSAPRSRASRSATASSARSSRPAASCWHCLHDESHLCENTYAVMGSPRVTRGDGTPLMTMTGLGTFAEYMTCAEMSARQDRDRRPRRAARAHRLRRHHRRRRGAQHREGPARRHRRRHRLRRRRPVGDPGRADRRCVGASSPSTPSPLKRDSALGLGATTSSTRARATRWSR